VDVERRTEGTELRPVADQPDVVHPADRATGAVEDLPAEQLCEPHAPAFVQIMSGIVAIETTVNRARYANAIALRGREFTLSPMYVRSFATIRIGK
jgi:hypothetical protein